MTEESIGVGIVGFGRIGAEHAGWLAAARGARAVAAFDLTPARRALAEGRGLRTVDDLGGLLNDPAVGAVLISTPTALHAEHAGRALAAGKHVLVEKPMTLDLPQARGLVEAARRAGRVLSVFHNRRWDADYLAAREAVASGKLGRVFNVESRLGQWASCVGPAAPQWRPGWRNEAAFGGGGLYDWGSHFVDQLWRLLWPAKPVRVFAQLAGNVWARDCDDFARVLIDFDSGAAGLVEINTTTTRPLARWHLDGTAGSAEAPYSLAFDLKTWAELDFTPAASPAGGSEGGAAERVTATEPAWSEVQIWERFAAAVRGVGEPAVPAASVLPTMALLDAARESARAGRAVDVRGAVEWVY